MIEKLKTLFIKLNKTGIPLPMLTDPKTGKASVSLTMLFISFNVFLLGLIGKVAGKLGGIDLTQALYWNVLNASLYFSRTLSIGPNKVENKEIEKND